MTYRITVFSLLCSMIGSTTSFAAPVTIVDSTPGTAFNDGVINAGEYVGSSKGINGGFGDILGQTSQIHVDSSLAGGLNFGLAIGAGNLFDDAVIYIDSQPGGFASTTLLNDKADPLRAAISGNNGAGGSELTFAPTFAADFAIGFNQGFAGLWQLVAGGDGSLAFLKSVNLTPLNTATSAAFEMDLLLTDIGLAPGDSFRYVATYMNANGGLGLFRGNEFHGVSQTTIPGGNIGVNPFALAAGDFNTFQSIPEPATIALAGVAALGLIGARRKSSRNC